MNNTLKSVNVLTATLITFGSLAGGANAAVTYYIHNSGSKVSVSTLGGTLNLSSDILTEGGTWPNGPKAVFDSSRTGVTNVILSESVTGTITETPGWTDGNLGTTSGGGLWSGVSSFMMLITARPTFDNLYLTDGTIAGVVNVGAGVFTTSSDYSVAGLGLTDGESVTWTSNTSGDTVTYVVGSVPEPSSTFLLSIAAFGLVIRRKRR